VRYYNLAFDTQPADDAIIYVNHDSPVLTSVKICPTSFRQTLKPRIVSRIRCATLAFGIWLIRVILSSAPPHLPFTGQPGLQVPLAENDPLRYGQLFLDDQI